MATQRTLTLSVADVARLRGVGRVAAYRWLLRNGARWLRRRGRLVVIDSHRYAFLCGERDRVEGRMSDLESRVADLEQRFDAHVAHPPR